jgi:hypothetical protein
MPRGREGGREGRKEGGREERIGMADVLECGKISTTSGREGGREGGRKERRLRTTK